MKVRGTWRAALIVGGMLPALGVVVGLFFGGAAFLWIPGITLGPALLVVLLVRRTALRVDDAGIGITRGISFEKRIAWSEVRSVVMDQALQVVHGDQLATSILDIGFFSKADRERARQEIFHRWTQP